MSLTLQNESLKIPKKLPDLTWQVSLETQLTLPEDLPAPETILACDFQYSPPQLTVVDDLLLVSGRIFPSIIYRGPKTTSSVETDNGAGEAAEYAVSESYDSSVLPGYLPDEYGYSWPAELGLIYQEQITIPGLTAEMVVEVDLLPLTASFERSGPDLLSFNGRLEILAHISQSSEAQIITEIATPSDEFKLLKETIQLETITPTKRTFLPLETYLVLPAIKPRVSRVLKHYLKPAGLSIELLPGKAVVKGFLEVTLIYVGSDDAGQPSGIFVNEWLFDQGTAIPFETSIETNTENLQAEPGVIIYHHSLTRQSPGQLLCQAQLDCEVKLFRPYQQEIVTDVITGPAVIIDQQKYLLEFEEFFGTASGELEIDQDLELPFGLPGIDRILSQHGQLTAFKTEADEGRIFVEGNLNLELLYTKSDFAEPELVVANWNSQIPVNGIIPFLNLQPAALLQTKLSLDSIKLEIRGEHKLRLVGKVTATTNARLPRAVFVMRECAQVESVDPDSRPSMLFYIVQPGDTLWQIARRYQSTVASLEKTNNLTNYQQLTPGQKILIPKLTLAV